MGLGSVVMTGYIGILGLQTLGFRYNEAKEESGAVLNLNPAGLDGIFESYQPPYYKNMDAAVDAFVEKKFGSEGTFARDCSGVKPFKDWDKVQPGYYVSTETAIQITKDYCNYI